MSIETKIDHSPEPKYAGFIGNSRDTTQRHVYVFKGDIARLQRMYQIGGIHGMLSKCAQRGIHLEVFLEEINRGLHPAEPALLEAIHLVRTALARRDSGEDDKG